MKHFKVWLAGALMIVLSTGCSEDPATDPLGDAWQLFINGQYTEAQTSFEALIETQPGQAYAGLGWTAMKLDNIPASVDYFEQAAGDSLVHGYAGWAIASWANKDFTHIVERAGFVVRKEPTFEFEFYKDITISTMRLMQAYGYYHTGNMSACLARIQELDGGFASTTDPALLLAKLDALSAAASGL